ncbi:MAG: hypothetical protein A2V70_20560 [Planctomycetes bacterium RBG_13_63_9]|nr:MAG: hypothetical protein A2V70_20560 [Planctomycetes bacterium RBG_13_63_9]
MPLDGADCFSVACIAMVSQDFDIEEKEVGFQTSGWVEHGGHVTLALSAGMAGPMNEGQRLIHC